jgi:hypothetical protein
VVKSGRPLQIRLDERVTIHQIGQPVSGTVIEPVYAYDRVVIPAGAKVRGHIAEFGHTSKLSRARTILAGDFTPPRPAILQFDTLIMPNGVQRPLSTRVGPGKERLTMSVTSAASKGGESKEAGAGGTRPEGLGVGPQAVSKEGNADDDEKQPGVKDQAKSRAKEAAAAAKERVGSAVAGLRAPNKKQRLKEYAISQLPYHPQYIHAGTVYGAELLSPLDFGEASPIERAPAGTTPAPESILNARLTTSMDSAKTPRGSAMTAVLAQPVMSSEKQLVLPEGTVLDGSVTYAKPARSLHRNGQLRFLIERARAPETETARALDGEKTGAPEGEKAGAPEERSETMLASLYAVQASEDERVAVDDEGGAKVTNSKTRFIAPALSLMALRGSIGERRRPDGDGDDVGPAANARVGNGGAQAFGGFLGFSAVGVGIGLLSRPAAIAFAVWGASRAIYSNILGKGHEVSFPADTPIQVQLSPGGRRQNAQAPEGR